MERFDGLPVIKSVFLEKGIVPDLAELLDKSRCQKMIIKPCGNFSHSILKVPKTGDFRVQSEYGGTVQKINTDIAHLQAAGKYVEKYGKGTLYARVDGIISNGTFVLMELELIEPYTSINRIVSPLLSFFATKVYCVYINFFPSDIVKF